MMCDCRLYMMIDNGRLAGCCIIRRWVAMAPPGATICLVSWGAYQQKSGGGGHVITLQISEADVPLFGVNTSCTRTMDCREMGKLRRIYELCIT